MEKSNRSGTFEGRHDKPADQIRCDAGIAADRHIAAVSGVCRGAERARRHCPDPAGFWLGLWQGLISPITSIVSLFTTKVNIYEVQNNGNWYDFGFMLGVACAFSSGGWAGTAGTRRTRRRAGG
jgi:hypothetical protein